ncbi:MAG: hypothetical protein QXQ14_02910 [Candidatus Aenigmatarchaeota archaeon]
MIELIKKFSIFYPIRGKNEEKFLNYLTGEVLKDISFELQKFKNKIPKGKIKANVKVNLENSGLKSGKIENKNIVNSIYYEDNKPNINFNPYCKEISLPSFYNAPSVAIARKDLNKILEEDVKIKVKVLKERFRSANILIGNLKNPEFLIFSHFDTVLNGAVDNSSGIAVIISLIKEHPELLKNNLFILSGSEELSFENPYWGYGYRVFEKEYEDLIFSSKRILVVDSVGFTISKIFKNREILWLAFPIRNFEKILNKTFLLSSIFSEEKLKEYYTFYHSNLDTVKNLKEEFLLQAKRILKKFLV